MKNDIYSKIIADSQKTKSKPAMKYRYSRTAKSQVQLECTKLPHVTILEGPDKYWIYDEDAVTVSALFGQKPFETKKGHTLVYDKTLHEELIDELVLQGFNCVVVHPSSISEANCVSVPSAEKGTVEEDVALKLTDSSGQVHRCIIKSTIDGRRLTIHHADGTAEIIRAPILQDQDDPDIDVITPQAPLAQLLIGKHVGETVSYKDDTYTITEIDQFD